MNTTRDLTAGAALALFFASCSTYPDSWPESDGSPDLALLEQQRRDVDSDKPISGVSWLPLVRLHGERYGPSKPGLPEGTTYSELYGYGPLLFAGAVHKRHYDEAKALFERGCETYALWGLWQQRRTDVRVPSGWRVEAESSLLFGLLRWPDSYYVDDAPQGI